MKKIVTLTGLLLATFSFTQAQFTRYVVQLTDKKGTPYTLSNPQAYLSKKALTRRANRHIAIDSSDLPVTPAYLDSIRKVPSVTVLNVSKWLNQVLIKTTDPANALAAINAYPFVKKTSAIAPRVNLTQTGNPANKFEDEPMPLPPGNSNRQMGMNGIADLNYGDTYAQVHIHEGEYLHNLGYTGQGMTIAVLDAGFNNYLYNPVFDSVRNQGLILGTWDYVMNEASVNEDHSHGAYVLSTMASNSPGVMIGTAPHASYWLLRTEDAGSEYPVEEQNWVAAAEFADSVGVDMITTSLGYENFDDGVSSHTYAQRDGHTAIISIAASLAFQKGILVIAAAGNSGGDPTDLKYVGCPADADSVLTIGGVDKNGNIGAFSSWGPNGAGLLKPNVVSVGQNTTVASLSGTAGARTGTSFAAPNLAGLVACLWQAFPEFTNTDIFDVVQKSSSQYDAPDYRYGHGIPNFRLAYGILTSLRNAHTILSDNWIKAYPVPVLPSGFNVLLKAQATGNATLTLYNAMGQMINTREINTTAGQYYWYTYDQAGKLSKGVYYLRYYDGSNKHILKLIR